MILNLPSILQAHLVEHVLMARSILQLLEHFPVSCMLEGLSFFPQALHQLGAVKRLSRFPLRKDQEGAVMIKVKLKYPKGPWSKL